MQIPIIPQFTLRRLLTITTLAAFVFTIVALGVHGSHWAAAITIGGLALIVLLIVHALFFAVVWGCSWAIRRRQSEAASPFRKIS